MLPARLCGCLKTANFPTSAATFSRSRATMETRSQIQAPAQLLNPTARVFSSSSWAAIKMGKDAESSLLPEVTSQEDMAISQGLRKVDISAPSAESPALTAEAGKKKKKKDKKPKNNKFLLQAGGAELQGQRQSSPSSRKYRDRDPKVAPTKASGGIPNPALAYLAASQGVPQELPQPQHLLVVIDLNGTVLFRPNKANPTRFDLRPHAQPFLKYCIETFTVVIWSSARAENVQSMCETFLDKDLLSKVVAIWGRDKFGLSPEDYQRRVQCYKRLTKLWDDPKIASTHPEYAFGGRWNQTNTVLMDDSREKARSEPFNLIEMPEFLGNKNGKEYGEILPQVHDHLNHLSMHSNVSACLRAYPFKPVLMPGGLQHGA